MHLQNIKCIMHLAILQPGSLNEHAKELKPLDQWKYFVVAKLDLFFFFLRFCIWAQLDENAIWFITAPNDVALSSRKIEMKTDSAIQPTVSVHKSVCSFHQQMPGKGWHILGPEKSNQRSQARFYGPLAISHLRLSNQPRLRSAGEGQPNKFREKTHGKPMAKPMENRGKTPSNTFAGLFKFAEAESGAIIWPFRFCVLYAFSTCPNRFSQKLKNW